MANATDGWSQGWGISSSEFWGRERTGFCQIPPQTRHRSISRLSSGRKPSTPPRGEPGRPVSPYPGRAAECASPPQRPAAPARRGRREPAPWLYPLTGQQPWQAHGAALGNAAGCTHTTRAPTGSACAASSVTLRTKVHFKLRALSLIIGWPSLFVAHPVSDTAGITASAADAGHGYPRRSPPSLPVPQDPVAPAGVAAAVLAMGSDAAVGVGAVAAELAEVPVRPWPRCCRRLAKRAWRFGALLPAPPRSPGRWRCRRPAWPFASDRAGHA
jgi:hypothetical protein